LLILGGFLISVLILIFRRRGETIDLITYMKHERSGKLSRLYRKLQINAAFHSNKLEGSQLSHEQTQHLFDEHKIFINNGESVSLDDINETTNHFRAFDYIIDHVNDDLHINMIKKLHYLLKRHTSDETNPLTPVGKFKIKKCD